VEKIAALLAAKARHRRATGKRRDLQPHPLLIDGLAGFRLLVY
jgi:hypothetical protein